MYMPYTCQGHRVGPFTHPLPPCPPSPEGQLPGLSVTSHNPEMVAGPPRKLFRKILWCKGGQLPLLSSGGQGGATSVPGRPCLCQGGHPELWDLSWGCLHAKTVVSGRPEVKQALAMSCCCQHLCDDSLEKEESCCLLGN